MKQIFRIALLTLLVLGLLPFASEAASPCIKHDFVSGKADGADATIVRPSDWNACHTIEDDAIAEGKLDFDPATQTELDAHLNDAADAHDASAVGYTPTTAGDWDDPDPTEVKGALDQAASRIKAVEDAGGSDDQTAAEVPYTPTTAADWDPDPTEVEGALDQAASRIQDIEDDNATQTELDAHINDAIGAHAASAVSVDSTNLDGVGTDQQTVNEELEDQIDTKLPSDFTGLTEDATPTGDDLLATTNDPAGTPVQRKITLQNASRGLDAGFIPIDSTNLDGVGEGLQTVLEELEDQIDARCFFTVSNVDPGAGAVADDCHLWINNSTTPKKIFYGEGSGNNFQDFAALGDAYNGKAVGGTTIGASGSEDVRYLDVLALATSKAAYEGTATFANQPSNDGIEVVSSAAGDTSQTLTAYCTLDGEDASLAHIITIALNGTTPVASTETNLSNCWVFILSATTTGNITIREASADQTIATITASDLHAADLDTVLTRRDFITITLNVDRDTALFDTDDRANFWTNTLERTVTIAAIEALTDTGTSTVNVQRNDGTPADICADGGDIVADSDGTFCAALSATEKLISNGHRLSFVMVTAATSGTPTQVTVNIKGY